MRVLHNKRGEEHRLHLLGDRRQRGGIFWWAACNKVQVCMQAVCRILNIVVGKGLLEVVREVWYGKGKNISGPREVMYIRQVGSWRKISR